MNSPQYDKKQNHNPPDRRNFLRTAAAGLTLSKPAYSAVVGSQEKLNVGMIGCGGRAQAHVNILKNMSNVKITAVCDVWDGSEEDYISTFGGQSTKRTFRQGLFPTAKYVGLNPRLSNLVTKDYRQLLDNPAIEAVCIATPDHWHAKIAYDALAAGKHVFIERPIAHTASQAKCLEEAAKRSRCVVSVGVQSLADPSIRKAKEVVDQGKLGPVVLLTGGAFRNDSRGQWRFYHKSNAMNSRTVNWNLFLGQGFEFDNQPIGPSVKHNAFSAERFTQWRCEKEFSQGPISEMLYPVVARLLAISGHKHILRTNQFGQLSHEKDGRTIFDTVTLNAELSEGSQLSVVSTTLSNFPCQEVVRGRLGSLCLGKGKVDIFSDNPNKGTTYPQRLETTLKPTESILTNPPHNETEALWLDFIHCIQINSKATLCPPELACAAVYACSST